MSLVVKVTPLEDLPMREILPVIWPGVVNCIKRIRLSSLHTVCFAVGIQNHAATLVFKVVRLPDS
jgi:hypothetical protein